MKTALFRNFTPKTFTGWWNGKKKVFEPGDELWMPDYLARHFALGLTNQELLRKDDVTGELIYKDGERMTSPKFPEQVPLFMELYNQAYLPDNDEEDMGEKEDEIDALIGSANKNRQKKQQKSLPVQEDELEPLKPGQKQDPTKPQLVDLPVDDDDENEESFQGKPVE